jgi:type II restriction/modification system DNA methylase subunit YeeA
LKPLITIPNELAKKLEDIKSVVESDRIGSDDIFNYIAGAELQSLRPIVRLAQFLAKKYDCVVANPPYMGIKGMNPMLKDFAQAHFPASKSDLFAMFIERGFNQVVEGGYNSMVTMQSWMFLSSYENLREKLLKEFTITCMVHMANMVMKIAFGTAATVWHNVKLPEFKSSFSYVNYEDLTEENKPKQFPIQNARLKTASAADFNKIPGSPIAYWMSKGLKYSFEQGTPLRDITIPRQGLATMNNARFTRIWYEISIDKSFMSPDNLKYKWYPYNKGGGYRKWYGNQEKLVNWENSGKEIKKLSIIAFFT